MTSDGPGEATGSNGSSAEDEVVEAEIVEEVRGALVERGLDPEDPTTQRALGVVLHQEVYPAVSLPRIPVADIETLRHHDEGKAILAEMVAAMATSRELQVSADARKDRLADADIENARKVTDARIGMAERGLEADIDNGRRLTDAVIASSRFASVWVVVLGLVFGTLMLTGGFVLILMDRVTPGGWFAGGGVVAILATVLGALVRARLRADHLTGTRSETASS